MNGACKEGKWILKDGTTFTGSFVDGMPDGPGEYLFKSTGITQKGTYTSGDWIAA